MKKRTISKLKSLFSSKKGKRQQEQQHSAKSSRSPSPDLDSPSPAKSETFHPVQRTPTPSRVGPPPSPPVPTTPIVPVAPEPPGPLSLLPCQVCGRTFVQQSLAKHVKICEKMTVKKRKTFDSSRQRREGTDLEQYLPKNFGLPENSPFLEKSPPQVVKATPKPKVQSVRSAIMKPAADLQKCPHCNRAFGVRAFERHVEWCADKAKILPAAPAQPPPHIADAKQRLNARTQYKAPPVRGRRSSQSRDKSSLSRSTSVESTRGVSPAPPREYGDYTHGRTRASESLSSNDCIDDSPHIPVIRNSRAPQTNSSGDANVKARQARLARDLSNPRHQERTKASPIQLSTVPGPSRLAKNEKIRLDPKKRQKLKKLDEKANKYNGLEKVKENVKSNSSNKKNVVTKSQIPLPKNHKITQKTCGDNIQKKTKVRGATSTKIMRDLKCDKKDMDNESTMSLDSLDEINLNKNSSKDIRADMLCPCVPCVIHVNNEPISNVARKKTNTVKEFNKQPLNSDNPQKIRVLFKNLKFFSDKEKTETIKFKPTAEKNKNLMNTEEKCYILCNYNNSEEYQRLNGEIKLDLQVKGDTLVKTSAADFNHNVDDLNKENTTLEPSDYENVNYLDSRHGSGETYTKFSENPADLDEFFMITDQIINKQEHDDINNNITHLEKDIGKLHTPQTDSLETLNTDFISNEDIFITKQEISNALDYLKKDFKDLMLEGNTDSLPPVFKKPDYKTPLTETKKDNVSINNIDMKHITVYEFKHKKIVSKNGTDEENSNLTLPSINDTKKNIKHTSNKNKGFKGSRKIKMLSLQKRTSKNYQTFIIKNDDTNESNDDAPPLKLPRIENIRLDDNYDPFISAARQMKELMSTDKSIPKKANNNSKGNTNTLPNLKQAKDKMSLSHPRPDNTKMMKDTINKTYQKTPTLQRMKSFGSSNIENNNSFGGRCSSFRVNRNDKKPSQNLNSTFTKTSKENITSADKTYFNRNNSMNRSFSSYSNSNYSTPKLKDKIPKLSQSMHHGFQRNTIKQPLKLDKINKKEENHDPITLGSIFSYDNGSSMTDSNYIDPRLINENDNLPINVNTILNNPDIISSMESLLTTENLPAKFESFSAARNNLDNNISQTLKSTDEKNNNINNITSPTISDLSSRYDKIMSSLEQSVTSKTSVRDDDSLCEDFDLEEFMTSFDEEIHKQKIESKRTYSSTTRIVAHSEICGDDKKSDTKVVNSPKIVNGGNGMIPVNKSTSLVFSSNNITGEKFFPSSVKRSTSLLDSIQKKATKTTSQSRQSVDKLEDDIMQSLKDFDKFYASQNNDNGQMNKEMSSSNKKLYQDTIKREVQKKNEPKAKTNKVSNGNSTPNGKASNDSAYSSLNRISPSKLSLCKESNVVASLSRIPAGSDTSSGHKDDLQSISSDEFLAMERTAELTVTEQSDGFNVLGTKIDKTSKSRESSQVSPTWRRKETLSSSGSESSLYRTTKGSSPAPRLSRFCHECGSKFPVDTAKFCIECGVKRLVV